MSDADVLNLIGRYATSYYRSGHTRPCTSSDIRRAAEELKQPGAILEAMEENGHEAKRALEYITRRYELAQQDGLFDIELVKTVDKKHREAWLSAIQTQRGDIVRARTELAHWREYWKWAKTAGDVKAVSLRELAESKAI